MPKLTDNTAKVLAAGLGRGQFLEAHYRRAGAGLLPRNVALCDKVDAVRMKNFFARFTRDEAGVTVIEYGLIAALISVVCIVGMTFVGAGLQGVYNAVATAITPAL